MNWTKLYKNLYFWTLQSHICQVALVVKNHLPMQETQEKGVWFLGGEKPLEKEMAIHSCILFFENVFIYFNWRLITLQYCSGCCHTLTWIFLPAKSHGQRGLAGPSQSMGLQRVAHDNTHTHTHTHARARVRARGLARKFVGVFPNYMDIYVYIIRIVSL